MYPSLAEHPLPRLVGAGVLVTINTDTPAIFGTTLTAEAELLRTAFGLSTVAAQQVLQNAVEASFLSPVERDALRTDRSHQSHSVV